MRWRWRAGGAPAPGETVLHSDRGSDADRHGDGITDYYAAYGRAIAVRHTPASGTMTLSYLLSDHLGSTSATIDAATGAIATAKYWPYGAPRTGAITQTDKLYTGQQQETGDALGLYFYHARFYSTTTGRFVSADTAADGLNRYAYVHNNPMRYIDPTGHDCGSNNPNDGILWNPCTMVPTSQSNEECGDPATCLQAVAAACDAMPGAYFCPGYAVQDNNADVASPQAEAPPLVRPNAQPLRRACGGDCPSASTDTSTDGCPICDAAGAVVAHAPGVAKQAANDVCKRSATCTAIKSVAALPTVNNAVTSSCFRGVTKLGFVGAVVGGSIVVVVVSGGTVVAAGGTLAEGAAIAATIGIGEGVTLAPQANRLWSNLDGGLQDVQDACF